VGNTVKRQASDHMMGTVVDVHDSYILQPICRPRLGSREFKFTFDKGSHDLCEPACEPKLPAGISHPGTHELLYNVPGKELKRAHDFQESDHVIYHDWVGTVRALEVDVAIILQNETVVWVSDPWELFVVIPNLDGPLVAIPELNADDVRLPEVNLALYNGIGTMQPEQFLRGQLVVTNHRNLKNGRWLHGGYDSNVEPAGHVLDVRSRRLELQWLCPSPFSVQNSNNIGTPPLSLTPYENLTSFRNARDLRRKRDIILYDHDKGPSPAEHSPVCTPMTHESAVNGQASSGPQSSRTAPAPDIRSMGHLRVGDQVKFVDATAALSKYSGTNGHGRFNKISREASFGFDLNEFKIISITEDVTVQWQDQSTSRHRSIEIREIALPEQDLIPGDLVTAKEGMKQVRSQGGQSITSEFNEMSYFEHQQDLRPVKVGVVQSVNSLERVARVRWFETPRIELLEAGTILSNESRLGNIGDSFEDVSLYEIMSFPALSCRRQDLVILVPPFPLNHDVIRPPGSISNTSNPTNARWGPALLSQLGNEDTQGLVSFLANAARSRLSEVMSSVFGSCLKPSTSGASSPDWIAEVIDIGLDGLLNVRFGALDPCQDVWISRDQVLLTIDEDAAYAGEELTVDEPGDDEEMFDDSDELDAIDEEINYEGGLRIDDDSDDSCWVTDEEIPHDREGADSQEFGESCRTAQLQTRREGRDQDIDMQAAPEHADTLPHPDLTVSRTQEDPFKYALTLLSNDKSSQPPSQFDIVSSIPANQFCASVPALTSPSFLKRIGREHKILRSSLPPNTIYVRTYESRLDLLRCLIIGPVDTPYELAPFLIDLYLGPHFPNEPPAAHFHSWTSGLGRINPNLYEEGKICLSLLGTWPGKSEGEGWSENATILQVLISLQGLVFVRQPLYNEAGFELYREEKLFTLESQQYNEKAYVIARGFLKHALLRPVEGLDDVLSWLYVPFLKLGEETDSEQRNLLFKAIERTKRLMQKSEELKSKGGADSLVDGTGETGDAEKVFLKPLSLGAMVQLRRTVTELEGIAEALVKGRSS